MRINRNNKNDYITIDQECYIDQQLKKFKMNDCNKVNTSIENFDFNESNTDVKNQNPLYQKSIGSLMYLAVLTRPAISYAVSFLSQFNNCNSDYHWKCAKRILGYLQGTKNYSSKFKNTDQNLVGFVDADLGSNKIDRKSYTGYIFQFSESSIS